MDRGAVERDATDELAEDTEDGRRLCESAARVALASVALGCELYFEPYLEL
jgi:hypothetical protein